LRLDGQEHVFILNMHHSICDGWSLDVLMHELTTLYSAFIAGEPSPLEPLPIQYVDYAQWQREWLSGPVLEAELNYWPRQLGGELPLLELPTDRPRPEVRSFRGSWVKVVLPATVADQLKHLSHGEEVTLFILLLAVFKTLLYRYTAEPDVIVGFPIANR